MATFVYKAYDGAGHKKTGTMHVMSAQEAYRALHERGLKAYFVQDLARIKQAIRHKRRVRKAIVFSGAVAIAAAVLVSGVAVDYAGRSRPLATADYRSAGVLTVGSGNIVADTEAGEQLARDMYEAWNSFAPNIVLGIEIRNGVMLLHVTRAVRGLALDDLERLAANTVRALHRQLHTAGATLLVLEDDLTLLEVRFNAVTNKTHTTRYF